MKNNDKKRIIYAKRLLTKRLKVLKFIAFVSITSLVASSCELDQVNENSDARTSTIIDFSDIINNDESNKKDDSNKNYDISLCDYIAEEDSTSFCNKYIRNEGIVRSLKKKKGR